MAAKYDQQEFALHSLNEECKNKTFVFVKLTDSALKSIEDYMNLNPNLRQNIAKPTIQFQTDSNQGAITLPLANQQLNSNNLKNETRYSFNLSNVDADGPGSQGSFEFLRQRRVTKYDECIESLGSMFIKMQIHASEDIYQKTKVKMANAELDAKKHSTKVIKETGPNVGRKIKKTILNTGGVSTLTNGTNILSNGNNLNDLQSSAYSSYKELLNSNTINNLNSTFESINQQQSPKSTIKFNNLINSNSSKLNNNSKDEFNCNSIKEKDFNVNSSQQNSNNNQLKSSTVNPELIRKPIRDRVIHLLALRPFKKPELHAKLNRDGLREKDKKGLSVLLSQIANLKDNAYHLHRGAWHEVQVDDWPFYKAEERELVRKRNPLTATSSTSLNQLNANSNNNSISAIKDNYLSISPLNNNYDNQQPSPNWNKSPSNKRTIDSASLNSNQSNGNASTNLDYDYAITNKKQRISHHKTNIEQAAIKKRSPQLSSSTNNSVMNNNTLLINNTSLISSSSVNQSYQSLNTAGRSSNNLLTNNSNKKLSSNSLQVTNKYDDVINIWENKPKTPDEQQQITNGHPTNSHSSPESVNSKLDRTERTTKKSGFNSSTSNYRNSNANCNNSTIGAAADRYSNQLHHQPSNNYHSNQSSYQSNNTTNSSHFNINSFTNHHYNNSNQQQHNSSLCSTPNSSPDSGTGSNDGSLSTNSSRSSNSGLNVDSQADYLSKYTEITLVEQFRKYKQDFNYEYEEYKKLHNIVDRNANKFALLEQELRQAQEGTDSWNRIMERILREYEEIKRDNTYLNARSRMQYLHVKLSHIKSLILNFQNLQCRKHAASNRNSSGANCNSSSIKYSSSNNSIANSRNHNSVPVQQSNRSKMITSS